ncbi:hypothetical protein N2603_05450 [Bradyrhizobium huanghuaihaiense]|uniref:hypothetical protein n=1 Tax=Bradyrhizobium huanghuaihaiense TaxID=990078 RepID=UPI0021A9D963|nr:hypothetical protein [Bradyrhizobium sp. CB3035]UWU77908.1 hypothetical protein N2603_05450 [Bradyrhizobium sp. CB3035]
MLLEFCTIEALNLRPGSKELEAFNVERVRGYLERNRLQEEGSDPRARPESAHSGQGHHDDPGTIMNFWPVAPGLRNCSSP